MCSCLEMLEAFFWFVLITVLNVTLRILTVSVARLENLLWRLVAFLHFLNPQCLASISRWITALCSWKRFCFFFFQAEDGIRDLIVTGVQTCALPIFRLHPAIRMSKCLAERREGLREIVPHDRRVSRRVRQLRRQSVGLSSRR